MLSPYDQWKTKEEEDPQLEQYLDEEWEEFDTLMEFIEENQDEYRDFLIDKFEKRMGN